MLLFCRLQRFGQCVCSRAGVKQTFSPAGPPSPPSPPSPPFFWTHTGGRRARKEGRGGEGRGEEGEGEERGGSPLSCPPTQDPLWSPAWVWAKRKGEDARAHTHKYTHITARTQRTQKRQLSNPECQTRQRSSE